MHRLRLAASILIMFTATSSLANPAAAAASVDQTSTGTPSASISSRATNQVGQAFTAARSGALTRIDVGEVIQSEPISSLSVQIFEASSGLPSGAALASANLAQADIPSGLTGSIVVEFTSPTTVLAGRQYVFTLVPQSGLLGIAVVQPGSYSGGATVDNGPSSWNFVLGSDPDLIFTTYVDSGLSQSVETVAVEVTLAREHGVECTRSTLSGSIGTWISLPATHDCTVAAGRPNTRLLGWATSPNFPVAIAKRQVGNGWGAYETFDDNGRLTGVFIPSGGSTLLSAPGKLFPISSQ